MGNVEIKSGSIGASEGDAQTGSISGVEVATGGGMHWFALAVIAVAIAAAMAWGTNGFTFRGAGIQADSKSQEQGN